MQGFNHGPLLCRDIPFVYSPKGPRTQIIGFKGPNTINLLAFGP